MKKFKIALLAVLVFYLNKSYAQTDTTLNYGTPVIADQSTPVSWVYLDTTYVYTDTSMVLNTGSASNFRTSLGKYSLPYYSNATLQHYADSVQNSCKSCGFNKYYGYGIESTINLKNSAQYYNPNIAGGKLWILHMSSQTALGLQFYFSKFMIPTNSFMHIYTADRSKVLGPYTSDNTPPDSTVAIHFGSMPIFSNDVYIEYYESNSANYTGTIEFANVIHVFTSSFGSAADCQQDVACEQAVWNSATASAALVLIYTEKNNSNNSVNLAGTCSGNLLNDVQNDEKPYFLTAGHCYYIPNTQTNAKYDVSTWHFVFDYQALCCQSTGANDPGWTKVVYGAKALSADKMKSCGSDNNMYGTSDYLLLLLNSPPTLSYADWGVCFAGWDTQDLSSADDEIFTLIHHPGGDVMKISEGTNLIYSDPDDIPACPTDPTLTWANQYFYNVDFSGGVGNGGPEPGSSGAGLFNDQGRIIATVTGSDDDDIDPCQSSSEQSHLDDNGISKPDHYYFGRFNAQFPNFIHTVNGVVQNYLDPTGEVAAGLITGVSTHCAGKGPTLASCPNNNGNGNGNNTLPPGCPGFGINGINQGVKINGLGGLPVLCPTNNITISGFCSDIYLTAPYKQNTSCAFFNNGGCKGCNASVTDVYGFSYHNLLGACDGAFPVYWFYTSYVIQMVELDENLNPVGSQKTKLFTIPGWMGDDYETVYTTQPIFGFSNFSFQVSNVSAGYVLQPGHFYQIGIGSSNEPAEWGTYQNASRLVYIMPNVYPSDAYTSALTTIGDPTNLWDNRDLYATTDIVLTNKKVLTDINEVAAGSYIDVQGTGTSGVSDLQGGHYFTSAIACNTTHNARMANTNTKTPTNKNSVTTGYMPSKSNYIQNTAGINQSTQKSAAGFSLYPNPANDNLIAEFAGTLPTGNGSVTISIYNSLGQMMQNTAINNFQRYINLNVGELTTGMYNIIITQGGKTWQNKIIKQ
jgi:hypothetical protein